MPKNKNALIRYKVLEGMAALKVGSELWAVMQ